MKKNTTFLRLATAAFGLFGFGAIAASHADTLDVSTLRVSVYNESSVDIVPYPQLDPRSRASVDRMLARVAPELAGCKRSINKGSFISYCEDGIWMCAAFVDPDGSSGGACASRTDGRVIFW